MTVDPSLLQARAAKFHDAATEQVVAGSLDQSQSESDIAAFGEINASLHHQFRMVKELQAQAWAGLGKEHDMHAEKLSSAARGYGNTDGLNAQTLRAVPEGAVTVQCGPPPGPGPGVRVGRPPMAPPGETFVPSPPGTPRGEVPHPRPDLPLPNYPSWVAPPECRTEP